MLQVIIALVVGLANATDSMPSLEQALHNVKAEFDLETDQDAFAFCVDATLDATDLDYELNAQLYLECAVIEGQL